MNETSEVRQWKTAFVVYQLVYFVYCIYQAGFVIKQEIQLATYDFVDCRFVDNQSYLFHCYSSLIKDSEFIMLFFKSLKKPK
jgi:hypothetical protein